LLLLILIFGSKIQGILEKNILLRDGQIKAIYSHVNIFVVSN